MPPVAAADNLEKEEDVFELIPFDNDWTAYEAKSTPRHTASRLKRMDPAKYAILKAAMDEGASKTTLAKTHKVGTATLYAIIEAELGGLEAHNRKLAGKYRNAAGLALDRAMELIPEEKSVAVLAMASGIFYDKAAAASGAPGLVIEHRYTVQQESMNRINDMLASLGMGGGNDCRAVQGVVIDQPEEVAA